MKDTAGNEIYTPQTCTCGLTGGCDKCNPFIGKTKKAVYLKKECIHNFEQCGEDTLHCTICGMHIKIINNKLK